MSRTTELLCVDNQEVLWIGQGNHIYTGEEETMKDLNDFLQRNKGKLLLFVDEFFIESFDGSMDFNYTHKDIDFNEELGQMVRFSKGEEAKQEILRMIEESSL